MAEEGGNQRLSMAIKPNGLSGSQLQSVAMNGNR